MRNGSLYFLQRPAPAFESCRYRARSTLLYPCHSARQPNHGRRSTYRCGKSVQTNGTTSDCEAFMGVQPEDKRSDEYERFRSEAQRFFDAQLEQIGLGEAQIQSQNIAELEGSLARVDDALRSPESFGVLKLSFSANAAVFIVKSDAASHIEVGVVPLLLERKKLIVDRLRLLRKQRPISTLSELINSVSDSGLRDQLRSELEATRHVSSPKRHSTNMRRNYAFIAMAMDPQILSWTTSWTQSRTAQCEATWSPRELTKGRSMSR